MVAPHFAFRAWPRRPPATLMYGTGVDGFLLTRAGLVEHGTYDVISPSCGLPSHSQRVVNEIFESPPGKHVVTHCLIELLHDSVLLARSSPPPPMREKCPICGKICQTSGLSNHVRRCKGPRGVVNPGSKKRLRPGQEALRESAKIPRRENRRAESRERQEIRDLVNEVRAYLQRVCCRL